MIKKIVKRLLKEDDIMLLKSYFKSDKEKQLIQKRRAFYKQFLPEGATYYDIGANYGNRIEPIINEGYKIVAIEPQENCIKYLKKRFKNKISIVEKGLASEPGVQTMYKSNAHTLSTLSKEWIDATKESGRFGTYSWDKKVEIEIDTLDNVIAKFGLPNFAKIDVEGYEYEVLKGLSKPINFISLEYAMPEATDTMTNCIERLNEIGGDTHHVSFNYSVSESMEWAMDQWISVIEMKELLHDKEFIETGFGDIYAKTELKN